MVETNQERRAYEREHRDAWADERRSLGGLLTVAARALTQEFHRRLDAAGYADIRPGSGSVFEHIGTAGSTVVVMSGRAGISPQAMVQLVDHLEAHGFVERIPDPSDRRAKLVRLTERGQTADQVSRELLAGIEAEWAALVGEHRFHEARQTLADVITRLTT